MIHEENIFYSFEEIDKMNGTSSKNILVTGVGSNLIDLLLEKGHQVTVVDSFQTGSPRNLQHLEGHPRFKLINHNIQTPFEGFDEIDQIYNLACPASPVQYQKDPVSTLRTCFRGTVNLLELARTRNIRILHTSTPEVYGDPKVHPQPESYWGNVNCFGPRACYDEGKRVGEALCYAYREQFNIDVKIARIFNAYGPRLCADDGRVISSFISSALAGQALRITGDGTATRSLQYVSDCVEGLYTLMNSDYRDGPVNIGNDAGITIQHVAELTADLVSQMSGQPRVSITYHPVLVDDVNVRRPDITLAKKKLGWAPVVKLQDGLRKTIEWHMHHS